VIAVTGGRNAWRTTPRPGLGKKRPRITLAHLGALVAVPALFGVAHAEPADFDAESPPDPVPEAPPLERFERKVLVGGDFGVAMFVPRGERGVSYEPAPAWGGHARVELRPWIGLRLGARNSRHRVDLARGALRTTDSAAIDGAELDHPPLDVWLLGARLEPTWVATPRLRLWAGPGVGWARIETDAIEARIPDCTECRLETAKRSGSAVELSGALGATLDVVPHWLAASLAVSAGGFVGNAVGNLFDAERPMQAFGGGSMLHVAALPELGGSYSMLLSMDLLF
jgi:hypothetical protein